MDGERLRKKRLKMGLTLQEAADQLGVNRDTLSRWEREIREPQPHYISKICDFYEISPAMVRPPDSIDDIIGEMFGNDMSTKIFAYIFAANDISTLQQQIIREIENNRMDNNQISRREALKDLRQIISFPFVVLQLDRGVSQMLYLIAGGITACEDLARGGKDDIDTAYKAASAYASYLMPVVKDSSTYRHEAARLLAQCLLLKSILAPHVESLAQATQYAQEAAIYAQTANDAALQATALMEVAQAYYYGNYFQQALQVGEEAVSLIQSPNMQIAHRVFGHCYSHTAKFQAAGGKQQEALTSLNKAHEHFYAQTTNDPPATYVDFLRVNLILREGLTYSHLDKHKESLDCLSQVDKLSPGEYSEQTRVETKSNQALAALKQSNQDIEQVTSLWLEGMLGIRAIRSRKHFEEACRIYQSIKCVWPDDKRVTTLKELTFHW